MTTSSKRQWFRVYFNHAAAAPHVWSIDQGGPDSEFRVQSVQINVKMKIGLDFDNANPDQPKVWLEGYAHLSVINGKCFLD